MSVVENLDDAWPWAQKTSTMPYWVHCPAHWKLQDVQAYLNVVIAFVCAGSIFVLVRFRWQRAAGRVAKGDDVLARHLLSLNTVGEACDAILLLREQLLSRHFWDLLLQSLMILIFTIASLFSGIIARAFSNDGQVDIPQIILGHTSQSRISFLPDAEFMAISNTVDDLNRADFPLDQLLDFVPYRTVPWKYAADQWNSSWSMDCDYLPLTIADNVYATGNCSNGAISELPWLNELWKKEKGGRYSYSRQGNRYNAAGGNDYLFFLHGTDITGKDQATQTATSARILTIAVHMQDIPWNSSTQDCSFGVGHVPLVGYTEMTCNLEMKPTVKTDVVVRARPELYDNTRIASAYKAHYGAILANRSSKSDEYIVIPGTGLARFYQSYHAVKDTWHVPADKDATQLTNVATTVAQVSVVCIAVCALAGTVILAGLVSYLVFLYRHRNHLDSMPQSKLDWMLWSMRNGGKDSAAMAKQRFVDAVLAGSDRSEHVALTHQSRPAVNRLSSSSAAGIAYSQLSNIASNKNRTTATSSDPFSDLEFDYHNEDHISTAYDPLRRLR
ncbi:hypothetical protein LTR70_000536 [Exophiala xenobiotica]|uniref:Uncharacterized protein n=1 Tax=Lithohypha guttulata TaxID=1690604 RepID=A0ABR0KD22_9EURO|nr:hypothetical protein LTR24_004656 [Lithohypha guttulata]KAK5329387.1 hypothetical protein LTR70_000536 [Exophiala xenobiotica]